MDLGVIVAETGETSFSHRQVQKAVSTQRLCNDGVQSASIAEACCSSAESDSKSGGAGCEEETAAILQVSLAA
jgi:hypothetical protein